MTPPSPGSSVEIDAPSGTVTRQVATVRDHGDGRFTLTLGGGPDGVEVATVVPGDHGGWLCVEPPVDIAGAVHTAERVRRGEVLHGSATAPLNLLADAVLLLTGRPLLPRRQPFGGGRR